MQKLISLLILSFLFTIGYSQNPANGKSGISGKVVDQSGNAISFANVAVYKKADSSLYTGVATDMNGKFSIALPQSDYYLKLTFLSYKPKTIGGISVKESEWLEVGAFVYKNFDEMSGVSFLPHSDHSYQQAPYQEVDKDAYNVLLKTMPKMIDWAGLSEHEKDDNTNAMQTLACSGDTCEIVDIS